MKRDPSIRPAVVILVVHGLGSRSPRLIDMRTNPVLIERVRASDLSVVSPGIFAVPWSGFTKLP
jgi:hypothetical protein